MKNCEIENEKYPNRCNKCAHSFTGIGNYPYESCECGEGFELNAIKECRCSVSGQKIVYNKANQPICISNLITRCKVYIDEQFCLSCEDGFDLENDYQTCSCTIDPVTKVKKEIVLGVDKRFYCTEMLYCSEQLDQFNCQACVNTFELAEDQKSCMCEEPKFIGIDENENPICATRKIEGCYMYEDADNCKECGKGYIISANKQQCQCTGGTKYATVDRNEKPVCALSEIANCVKHKDPTGLVAQKCDLCEDGYFKQSFGERCDLCSGFKALNVDHMSICATQEIADCQFYVDEEECYGCYKGYVKADDGSSCTCEAGDQFIGVDTEGFKICLPLEIGNCIIYEQDTFKCSVCRPGYQISSDKSSCTCDIGQKYETQDREGNNICVNKFIPSCTGYSDLQHCEQCGDPLIFNDDKTDCICADEKALVPTDISGTYLCLEKTLQLCEVYVSETQCFSCIPGFEPSEDQYSCVCIENKFLANDFDGEALCLDAEIKNCIVYSDMSSCYGCETGFEKSDDGTECNKPKPIIPPPIETQGYIKEVNLLVLFMGLVFLLI